MLWRYFTGPILKLPWWVGQYGSIFFQTEFRKKSRLSLLPVLN